MNLNLINMNSSLINTNSNLILIEQGIGSYQNTVVASLFGYPSLEQYLSANTGASNFLVKNQVQLVSSWYIDVWVTFYNNVDFYLDLLQGKDVDSYTLLNYILHDLPALPLEEDNIYDCNRQYSTMES